MFKEFTDRRFKQSLYISSIFVFILWLIHVIQWISHEDWFFLGVLPRNAKGLAGIITMPLVHASWEHLFANSFSAFLLVWALFLFHWHRAFFVLFFVWIVGGFWLWTFGRELHHVGASGVIFGLFGFLFLHGVLSKKREMMAFSLFLWFLYAGSLWGLLPSNSYISWEGHLTGLLAGVSLAIYFKTTDVKILAKIWSPDDEFVWPDKTTKNKIFYTYKKSEQFKNSKNGIY